MRKSYRIANAAIGICLLALFFYLGHYIRYSFAFSLEKWISLTFLVVLLLGTQSLIHIFIGRMQLAHPLPWQISSVLTCDFMWIYLFLSFASGFTMDEALLEIAKIFIGFLIVHGIVFGEYALAKRLMASK